MNYRPTHLSKPKLTNFAHLSLLIQSSLTDFADYSYCIVMLRRLIVNIANQLDKTLRQKGPISEVIQSGKAVNETVQSAAKRIAAESEDVVSQNKWIKLDDEVGYGVFDDQTMNISGHST